MTTGHFIHANHYRLRASLRCRFPWLDSATRPLGEEAAAHVQPSRSGIGVARGRGKVRQPCSQVAQK